MVQEIAMIKVVAPQMGQRVVDAAMQIHGGMGVSGDTILARAFAAMRCLRIADGPDEVHIRYRRILILACWRWECCEKNAICL
jgi:alkylation response protein AidB-like acyl-CoA dehydrogenase